MTDSSLYERLSGVFAIAGSYRPVQRSVVQNPIERDVTLAVAQTNLAAPPC